MQIINSTACYLKIVRIASKNDPQTHYTTWKSDKYIYIPHQTAKNYNGISLI